MSAPPRVAPPPRSGEPIPAAAIRPSLPALSPARNACPGPSRAEGAPRAPAPASARAPTATAAAIRPDDLTPEIRRLLWYHVDTVEKLALLDHARAAAVPWTTQQAAAALGLDERAIVVASVGLCQAALLRRCGDTHESTPKAALLGAALDVLRRAYGADPAHVLRAIARLVHGRTTS